MFGLTLRTVLFLHAHPDDETLATGGTITRLVDDGVRVGVLTATRGERGDVVPGSLGPNTDLTSARLAELALALEALGVTHHFFLGDPPARVSSTAPRRYTDSGMQWSATGTAAPANHITPDCLTAAPVEEVVADLGALIDAYRPELIISYDAGGGYGHPDHVRLQEAGQRSATVAGLPFAEVVPSAGEIRTDDDRLESVDVSAQRPRVLRALRTYRSQLEQVHDDHVIHVGGQRQELATMEYFRLR